MDGFLTWSKKRNLSRGVNEIVSLTKRSDRRTLIGRFLGGYLRGGIATVHPLRGRQRPNSEHCSLHSPRDTLVVERRVTTNQLRGFLLECGVSLSARISIRLPALPDDAAHETALVAGEPRDA